MLHCDRIPSRTLAKIYSNFNPGEAEEQADKQEQHNEAVEKKKKKKKKKKKVAKELEDIPPARRKSYTPLEFEKKFSSPLKLTLVRKYKNKKRKEQDVTIPFEEDGQVEPGQHEKDVPLTPPVALGEKLRCKHCPGAYSSLYNLKRHMKDMHSITEDQDMKGMVDKKSYCIFCTT